MSHQQASAEAPDFTLDHMLGHSVTLSQFRGKPAVVMFTRRDTSSQLRAAITTILRGYGSDRVAVLGIIDLRGAPRPARMIIRGKLKKGYEESVADVKAQGLSGEIHMLVDWTGKVIDSFGVSTENQAVGAALDAQGRILGWGSGEQMGQQILAILPAT